MWPCLDSCSLNRSVALSRTGALPEPLAGSSRLPDRLQTNFEQTKPEWGSPSPISTQVFCSLMSPSQRRTQPGGRKPTYEAAAKSRPLPVGSPGGGYHHSSARAHSHNTRDVGDARPGNISRSPAKPASARRAFVPVPVWQTARQCQWPLSATASVASAAWIRGQPMPASWVTGLMAVLPSARTGHIKLQSSICPLRPASPECPLLHT